MPIYHGREPVDELVEKRKSARIDVKWPISIYTEEGWAYGETMNISVDGISVSCDEPLRINEVYRMAIRPLNYPEMDVKGRIVWSNLYGIDENDTSIGIGICFVQLSEEDRRTLKELIFRLP